MKILFSLGFLFSLSASAIELKLMPVGQFGGFRVKADCSLDGVPQPNLCMFDTAGPNTILALTPQTAAYPKLGEVTLQGIGSIKFVCDIVRPASFKLAGEVVGDTEFLRCPGFPEESTPMIGIDFFLGKSFAFLFRHNELHFNRELPVRQAPFTMEGHRKGYLTFDGTINGHSARVFFDTGAPVTMVSHQFVRHHPEAFRLSTRPPSEMMIRNGLIAYEPLYPILVQGTQLKAEFVYGADLGPIVGDTPLDIVLGVNHMASANWYFDLKNLLFSVNN